MDVVSYNVGMARSVPYYAERRDAVMKAVTDIDADVICLQELFLTGDMKEMGQALLAKFPHQFQSYEKETAEAICGFMELWETQSCTSAHNGSYCLPHMIKTKKVSQGCAECLVSQYLDSGSYGTAFKRCKFYSGTTPWEGNNGLLLVSKFPLRLKKRVPLDGFFVKRDLLQAKIGDVLVGCTHFSVDTAMPYFGKLASYEAENQKNFKDTLATFKAFDGPSFFMGDLNSGPAVPSQNIIPYFGSSFAQVEAAGFGSSFSAMTPKVCTWCHNDIYKDNNALTHEYPHNFTLDHIIHHKFSSVAVPNRILHERNISLVSGVKLAFSDHYGIHMKMMWESQSSLSCTAPRPADKEWVLVPGQKGVCYRWTQHGVDVVTKQNKTVEYDKPKVNGTVTSRVQKQFRSTQYMETAINANMIHKFSCSMGDIVSRASSLYVVCVSSVVVALGLAF